MSVLTVDRLRQTAATCAWVVLAVPFWAVLASAALWPGAGWIVRALLGGFVALALARPDAALLVTLAFVGFDAILRHLGGVQSLRVSEVLVVVPLAAVCIRAIPPRSRWRAALTRSAPLPVVLFAAVVVASGLVWLRVDQIQTDYAGGYLHALLRFAGRRYFFTSGQFAFLLPTTIALEGLAIFVVVAAACRMHAGFFDRGLRMLVAGGAGLGLMSAVRLAEITLRNPGIVAALRETPNGLRISPQIPDYIAAGSYFALCWVAGIGIAIASRHRPAWLAAGVPLLGALYLTGSRSVIAAALAGLVVLMAVLAGRRLRAARGVAVFAAIILGVMVISYPWMSGRDLAGELAQKSLAIRLELLRTAVQVIESRPVFGVGLDRFFLWARRFASPELHAMWPGRMNPHNDFLRFGAELGLTGLAMFLWILGAAAWQIRRALSRSADPALAGLVGGLAAFLVTSLVSNPLMLREVSYVFWIALGLAVGRSVSLQQPAESSPAASTSATLSSRPWAWRWVGVVLVGSLAVSIPFRVERELSGLDLSRRSYGLLDWGTDPDGTPDRRTGPRATVFVDGRARLVVIPLVGTMPSGARQQVEAFVNGRPANSVTVGSEWQRLRLLLPPDPPIGSHRVELVVSPTWVPALVAGGKDTREVGVRIGELKVLFDVE
jgi:O-antigen ligase